MPKNDDHLTVNPLLDTSLQACDIANFKIAQHQTLDLNATATTFAPLYESNKDYKNQLKDNKQALQTLQEKLYADNRQALLIIFQAMDAAGKDGAIAHVMSGVNPQGCQVHSFKQPSSTELEHDFLWRTHCALPLRGNIGIFNRSYYEEVLIVKVRQEILKAQNLPSYALKSKHFWQDRYASIVDSEAHLQRNGTHVIKFFLHVSKEEQRKRLLDRIDTPEKQWKFDEGDLEQRKCWSEYMAAYAECLSQTSTALAPWYLIPADDKKNARLLISQVIAQTLEGLNLKYPTITKAQRQKLQSIRI